MSKEKPLSEWIPPEEQQRVAENLRLAQAERNLRRRRREITHTHTSHMDNEDTRDEIPIISRTARNEDNEGQGLAGVASPSDGQQGVSDEELPTHVPTSSRHPTVLG